MTPVLSPIEARVLGTLMEKARTVPDSYPLTLNSLVLGCNQKSSREPLMNVSDAQAQEALDTLKRHALVFETSGSRVTRWEHNFQRAIGVPEQSAVLLGLLLLRGPQTAGELRINCERWYRFADISSVEGFLDELEARSPDKGGPLVVKLPRAAGMREQRWAHLLCGPVDAGAAAGHSREPDAAARGGLEARVQILETEVAQLRSALQDLCEQLGVSPLRQPEKHERADNPSAGTGRPED
ncbi:YceH family protein [Caenimonas terrae]|uniref:YceH family protein n=1 Tax=Caenimonas terrae TaxID=696074 RepID=A0ABW0NEL5_9BURK